MSRFLLTVLLIFLAVPTMAQASPLQIDITDAGAAGMIRIALFDTAEAFEEKASEVQAVDVMPDTGAISVTLTLPPGRYAVAVFQDADNDGKLTTNFIGLPTEKYGFSGKPSRFGPPSFAAASFAMPATSRIVIRLQSL